MAHKDLILTMLDTELTKLITAYEERICELEQQNEQLQSDIKILEKQNKNLERELTNTRKNAMNRNTDAQFLSSTIPKDKSIQYQLQIAPVASAEESLSLLLSCKQYLEQGEIKKVQHVFDSLIQRPDVLLHDDQEIKKLLIVLCTKIIILGNKDYNSLIGLSKKLLELIRKLHGTSLNDTTKSFLQEHYSDLTDIVLYMDGSENAILLLQLLMMYELQDELKEIFEYAMQSEWALLDDRLTEEQFTFFLWYAYIFDLDQDLIDLSEQSGKWLQSSSREITFYTYLYECQDNINIPDKKLLSHFMNTFKESTIFTEYDINMIIQKVKEELNSYIHHINLIPKFKGKLKTIYSQDLSYLTDIYKLEECTVRLPLYKQKSSNLMTGYVTTQLYTSQTNKSAFILSETVKEIEKNYYPQALRAKKHSYSLPTPKEEKKTQPVRAKDSFSVKELTSFQWPSTEVKEKTTLVQDSPSLSENSELKVMGYRITGLTRDKRWEVLRQAVPKLGLRKVANIIAYHIKLRKGQKNGMQKYHYAITEWEYDLNRLKQTYYKQDFKWPLI